ncbi:hypothetical protein Dalk_2799 [Desulfatibacillum aliphaticivorans]|uniref:Uncharacterized protein n=1 Tax=Desulfatibacillum aliphaticivorans TaxID=218208 RepID=B8FKW8_DESAL|nr:hypothetical protein [Desulfatibacillum aliphaticivorans]ACL04490.1 hypothetical protein Dalk_2799 [Desulfatibacillum aliphaticivorans]
MEQPTALITVDPETGKITEIRIQAVNEKDAQAVQKALEPLIGKSRGEGLLSRIMAHIGQSGNVTECPQVSL